MICYSLVVAFFPLEQVGLIAINDGLVLRSQISRIFKRYFYGKPYYVDLLDLFNEVIRYIQKSPILYPLLLQELNSVTAHLGRVQDDFWRVVRPNYNK